MDVIVDIGVPSWKSYTNCSVWQQLVVKKISKQKMLAWKDEGLLFSLQKKHKQHKHIPIQQ